MSYGPSGGGGWSDEPPDWGRPAPGGRPMGRPADTWGPAPRPRGRAAVHDPWSPRRGLGFGGMGGGRLPWVLAGFTVVLFAFLLGRCTAGGGDEEATDTTTTTAAIVTTTTIVIQTTHTVQENETLAAIASRYGVTIAAIAAANPEVTDINNIFRGQVLKIPAPVTATLPTTTTTAKKKNNG